MWRVIKVLRGAACIITMSDINQRPSGRMSTSKRPLYYTLHPAVAHPNISHFYYIHQSLHVSVKRVLFYKYVIKLYKTEYCLPVF